MDYSFSIVLTWSQCIYLRWTLLHIFLWDNSVFYQPIALHSTYMSILLIALFFYASGYCQRETPCFGFMNNGSHSGCSDYYDRYHCKCLPPLHGINCESGHCSNNPCLNGGSCKELHGGYSCQCTVPFNGKRCEIDPNSDPCQNNLCQNSNCSSTSTGYICQCPYAAYGDYCENIDYCRLLKPCRNNGNCSYSATLNNYTCSCPSLYSGPRCSIRHPCLDQPCQNNGKCAIVGKGFRCLCESSFTGERCQLFYGKLH